MFSPTSNALSPLLWNIENRPYTSGNKKAPENGALIDRLQDKEQLETSLDILDLLAHLLD